MKRRTVLSVVGTLLFGTGKSHSGELAITHALPAQEEYGCLVDTTLCVGCRECEKACNQANELPPRASEFSNDSVFESQRRPDAEHFTVVNRPIESASRKQVIRKNPFIKIQCMHCLYPACVSACIVGALQKTPQGSVIYDADRCIGCRYCMVACPFQIPAYEYNDPIAPRIRKCNFCFDRVAEGGIPACAEACPREAIVFGKRSELIEMAKTKIREKPGRYVDSIYGEKEVGGTSWLYLTGHRAEELGMPDLGEQVPPRLTESIQHGIFKFGLPPVAVYGILGGIMWFSHRKKNVAHKDQNTPSEDKNEQ